MCKSTTFQIAWILCSFQSSSEKKCRGANSGTHFFLHFFPILRERICKVSPTTNLDLKRTHGLWKLHKKFFFCIDNVKLEFLTAFSRAMNISLTLFACKAQLHNLFVATLWHETFVSIKQLTRKRGKLPPVYFKIWGINNFARKLSSLQVHNWENCPSSWKTFSIKFKTGPRGWNQARLDRRGGECSSGVRERGSGELRPLGALALSRLSSKQWEGSPQ